MAASPLNAVVFTFKPPSYPELTPSKWSEPLHVDSSSEDENEREDYEHLIRNGNKEIEQSIIDPRDEGTPDSWIHRNSSMIRHTGKHPFNAEPPLTRLMRHGFITPVPLHFVRNHGSVPKGHWEDWTVEVCGLVKRPTRFTMDQLVNGFPSREFPVTLVCSGNRRKEQNMVKQSIGYNWGAAAISTSVWRGAPLRHLLKRCGIYSRTKGAVNVCFEGAEDLPGGGGSKYGTCVKREIAMDPSRDIILAYMQNGDRLAPDHGFPVRLIVPGFIAGRMVKWLKRIVVTTQESDSYYHYKDNKLLPSYVDAELANAQRGGRKVTRVEVTLDGGETWQVATLEHPEKPNKYGKYWCWCFWSSEVEVLELLGSKEIAVRAWDEALNTQPENLIWNVMGMMTNCWFKVKTNVCNANKTEIGIVFQHPTQPGNQSGGWMDKERQLEMSSESNQTLKKSVSTPFMNTTSKMFSMSEVKKHNTADSAWIIVHGQVYDCTHYLKDHPGGTDSILINAGTDCTEEFEAIHSDKANKMLEDYRIGELMTTNFASDSSTSSPDNSVHGNGKSNSQTHSTYLAPIKEVTQQHPVALNPREKIRCKLVSKKSISHDVRLFRFSLPSEEQAMGLPVGKHIFLCATIDGKLGMRAYTPTSSVDEVGYFDLVVKIYFKGVNPKFSKGGLMSQHLDSLPIGSTLEVKGPLGHIEYTGRGNFLVRGKHKFAKKLAMLAGGTGIAPIYQVAQAILKDPEDRTEMQVICANRTEDDILLKEELDGWAKDYSERFKVWYVVSKGTREGWEYSLGHITESMIREHCPQASEDTLALACGPPPMIQFAVQHNLEKIGYDIKNNLLVF